MNLSPHFPYAAQLMLSMWQRQFGQKLDGVIAIDPVALSYLLAVTGPVKLADGSSVTSANVADLMMRSIYVKWPLPAQDAERGPVPDGDRLGRGEGAVLGARERRRAARGAGQGRGGAAAAGVLGAVG